MSQQGPILVVSTAERPSLASALDEAKLFPVVETGWADALHAVEQLERRGDPQQRHAGGDNGRVSREEADEPPRRDDEDVHCDRDPGPAGTVRKDDIRVDRAGEELLGPQAPGGAAGDAEARRWRRADRSGSSR